MVLLPEEQSHENACGSRADEDFYIAEVTSCLGLRSHIGVNLMVRSMQPPRLKMQVNGACETSQKITALLKSENSLVQK